MYFNKIGKKLFSYTLLISFAVSLAGCSSSSQDSDMTVSNMASAVPQGNADATEEKANSEEEQANSKKEQGPCEMYAYCNDKYFYSLSENNNVLVRDFEGKLSSRYKLKDLLGGEWIAYSYACYVNNEELFVEVHFWEEKDSLYKIPLDEEGMPIYGKSEKIYEFSDMEDVEGVYADTDYIIFFDGENVYREYDRTSKTYNTVDGTDAKYIHTNAWGPTYNIMDNLENGNILLEKDGALYAHQIGSQKVQPLLPDEKITPEEDLELCICTADGKIYYVKTPYPYSGSLKDALKYAKKQDIWYYDTRNGTNEKLVTAGQIQEALTGKQSDGITFFFSDIFEKDGKIYMDLNPEDWENDSKSTMQFLSYSPDSGSITYEKGVNDYLRYLEYDVHTDMEDSYFPYILEIINGKCIIDYDYREYYFDLNTGEKGKTNKKMPEYYYLQWARIPD